MGMPPVSQTAGEARVTLQAEKSLMALRVQSFGKPCCVGATFPLDDEYGEERRGGGTVYAGGLKPPGRQPVWVQIPPPASREDVRLRA